MLVVNRFRVTDTERFHADAKAALTALSACPGFVDGRCGGGLDDGETWVLVTRWETVGAYRRALSAYDVKMYATPLLAQALPEASAFEVNLAAEPGGVLTENASDRSAEPGRRDHRTSDDGAAAR
ncbi:MAG: antibiotic biosynthesis monooxygenase family protein [Stackebrandtia sp.]